MATLFQMPSYMKNRIPRFVSLSVFVARRVHTLSSHMRISFRLRTPSALAQPATLVALLLAAAVPMHGQSSLGEGRRQATRVELDQAAKATEQAAAFAPDAKTKDKLLADASAIRQRLRNGDFLPGDRVYVIVVGDSALTDTFTVRGDRSEERRVGKECA